MFFDPARFPFLEDLDRQAILQEGRAISATMQSLDQTSFQCDSLLEKGSRARFLLTLAGMKIGANQALCPRTTENLERVPGLVSAGFYLLGPRSKILPHTGARVRFLRVHLGVEVPSNCALRVGGETRAWQEGEYLVFDDSFVHEAWNDSDQFRCVFHLDFFHFADPSDWQPLARALRQGLLKLQPGYHSPLVLAGVETDADLLEIMRARHSENRLSQPSQLEEMARAIDSRGLFLAS